MSKFVNLHTHTDHSILDSIITTKDLFLKAKELNQKAVAITDHGTLGAVWEGLKASRETGVKFIVGCEFYFHSNIEMLRDGKSEEKIRHIILISKNLSGYKNLLYLNKKGFDNSINFGKKVIPLIDWNLMESSKDNLICLTACGNGIVGQSINFKNFEMAERDLIRLKEIYGDNLGAEIQANTLTRFANHNHTAVNQIFTNHHIIRLAQKNNIKIIPTSDAHYISKEDADAHDVFLAIGSMQPVYSNGRLRYNSSHDFYMKSEEEIKKFFSRNYGEKFADEICDNSSYFSDLCEESEWVDPKFTNKSGKELPVFAIKDELDYNNFLHWLSKQKEDIQKLDKDKTYLRFRCQQEFLKKVPNGKEKEYKERLEKELDTLYYCGVSSYMLIVADYVNWAKNNGVSVGVGRGSAGGSLVGYLLGIHMADPIKYGLVFERFHNKLKKAVSDIDVDFSQSGRDKIINYITNKYGQDNVANISNLIGLKPKVYVKDVSRSLELGGSRQDAVNLGLLVADFIPKEAKTIDDAIKLSPMFNEYCKKYTELKKYSELVNKNRNLGCHASGIVISERKLIDFTSVRKDYDGNWLIDFDKDTAEEAGLVKMDILGLKTLDIIDETNRLIKFHNKEVPKIDYEAYDKDTYNLIARGDTFCVFQFGESAGTIDLCKKINPKNIEDLAIITTIARPASKAIRADFIKTREGKRAPTYYHPSLKGAMGDTFGFSIYDESLLILARDVAGWDLGEADKLRKLTKEKGKSAKKVAQWRDDFIEGAFKNKIAQKDAIYIWDNIIDPFGRYSFNKSHAVLYSMISYHTAYLKAHYPLEFLLANLTSELKSAAQDSDKKADRIKHELRLHKIKILPPDINKSEMSYTLTDNNVLLTGLEALKFVSDEAIKDITSKRPFNSFEDFMKRTDKKAVRSNTIQALAASGCLDTFGIPRKTIFSYCSDYKKRIQIWQKKHNDTETFNYPFNKEDDWKPAEIYAFEKNYLGESFSCNKKDAYGDFFTGKYYTVKDAQRMHDKEKISPLKVEIKNIFEFKVKKQNSKFFGKSMGKVLVEDELGEQITMTVFPDRWEEINNQIKARYKGKYKFDDGMVLSINASINMYEDELGLILESVYDFKPPPQMPKNLLIAKKMDKISAIKEEKQGSLLENIEDKLYNMGLIEYNEDSENS